MAYTKKRRTRRSTQSGTHWLGFSDMMSGLVLVFILVIFYCAFQYLDMLEIKTAELVRQSGILDQKQAELDEKDAALTEKNQALTEKDEALKQTEAKLTAAEQEQIAQQAKLLLYEKNLDSANQLLEQQKQDLEDAQAQLAEQQSLLASAQDQLAEQQTLLRTQQQKMDEQQARLEALVGVRARIIASLGTALRNANVHAVVDGNTGAIRLDASVLFDSGKSELKESGKHVLDQFLPVYLSVLMESEDSDNVAEIIIEGHTDTAGTYMHNLKLSQERALSVMEYILADEYRGITGGMKQRLKQIVTANGRSYSNPVYNGDGSINMDASRRVEFKFRLQDEQMIEDMRTLLEEMDSE